MAAEWNALAKIYAQMGAPMRPSPCDVAKVNALIADHDENVLLLGATPEYSVLGRSITAIDATPHMIAAYWPKGDARRRGLLGDWRDLPFQDGEFTAVVGDGVLNSAAHGLADVLRETRRALRPGGIAAFRTFCAPDPPETLASIRDGFDAKPDANSLCLRMRMAMALAAKEPDYVAPIKHVATAFDEIFPDRPALAAQTGWTMDAIDRIDSMKAAAYDVGFPPRRYLSDLAAQCLTHLEFIESDGYPLAELCPILVLGQARHSSPDVTWQARATRRHDLRS